MLYLDVTDSAVHPVVPKLGGHLLLTSKAGDTNILLPPPPVSTKETVRMRVLHETF